jgi:hypothetical protein
MTRVAKARRLKRQARLARQRARRKVLPFVETYEKAFLCVGGKPWMKIDDLEIRCTSVRPYEGTARDG